MTAPTKETLLDFASQLGLSTNATHTIELLIENVAWKFDDHDYAAQSERDEKRQEPGYVPHFDIEALRRAIPILCSTDWLNLQLSTPPIVDIQPLAFFSALEGLSLGDNQIADVRPISQLANLRCLHLDRNPICDLSPLTTLTNLRELSITSLPVDDLSPLDELPHLHELTFSARQLPAFAKCRCLPSIQQVKIEGHHSPATEFESFPEMPQLRELIMSDIESFDGIQRFENLRSLTNISGEFEDLSPLASLHDLTHINVLGCKVRSIAPLEANTQLRSVSITSDVLTDISALFALPNLHEISIAGAQINKQTVEACRRSLSNWDTEFKAEHPATIPSPNLLVVDDSEFEHYNSRRAFGLENWNGDRGMLLAEADWLGNAIENALAKLGLEADDDFVVPFRIRYARSLTVCLYSERALACFKDVVMAIQICLCESVNEWIVYFQSDTFESGSTQEDFEAWVYRDKLLAKESSAQRLEQLLSH